VRQRKRKRQRLSESTVPAKRLRAERPDHVWALDFQFDTTSDGRTLKLLHVVDEYTREAMRVARSIDADHTKCSTRSCASAAPARSSSGWTTAPR
jgi:putative transposase